MSTRNDNSQGSSRSFFCEPGNPFYCSAEWHLREFNSRLAPVLYFWGHKLSYKSGCFFASVESVAEYFCCNRSTVFRAFQELESGGWIEAIRREPGKAVVYRFLNHDDWAEMHSGMCIEKDVMPWEGQGDPLGKALYAASGGLARFLPRQMNGLRKFGFTDDEIVLEFQIFLSRTPQSGRVSRNSYYSFRTHLLTAANNLRQRSAAIKNSSNKESH
jgi:hypothetical protein